MLPMRLMANNRVISRPKVLIVTPHPVIGAGIETVLRLEDLYDLRRVPNLADARAAAASWAADTALVDGVLLEGRTLDLGIPCIVLSGDASSGERLVANTPEASGWLLKDAPPRRMVDAIDRSTGIVPVRDDVRGTLGMVVAVVVVLFFLAALALLALRYLLS
jgi:hypothetical protein